MLLSAVRDICLLRSFAHRSAVILILRLYAMYDGNKFLLYGLLVMLVSEIGIELAIIVPVTAHQRCMCGVCFLPVLTIKFNSVRQWWFYRIPIPVACRTTRAPMCGRTYCHHWCFTARFASWQLQNAYSGHGTATALRE